MKTPPDEDFPPTVGLHVCAGRRLCWSENTDSVLLHHRSGQTINDQVGIKNKSNLTLSFFTFDRQQSSDSCQYTPLPSSQSNLTKCLQRTLHTFFFSFFFFFSFLYLLPTKRTTFDLLDYLLRSYPHHHIQYSE